jgi:hypothetical protein
VLELLEDPYQATKPTLDLPEGVTTPGDKAVLELLEAQQQAPEPTLDPPEGATTLIDKAVLELLEAQQQAPEPTLDPPDRDTNHREEAVLELLNAPQQGLAKEVATRIQSKNPEADTLQEAPEPTLDLPDRATTLREEAALELQEDPQEAIDQEKAPEGATTPKEEAVLELQEDLQQAPEPTLDLPERATTPREEAALELQEDPQEATDLEKAPEAQVVPDAQEEALNHIVEAVDEDPEAAAYDLARSEST